MKLKFEQPLIIGALCEKENEIPREIAAALARHKGRFALLPFEVQKRHLKNTVACMRLMDVKALFVCGRHKKEIAANILRLDPIARRSRCVDVVIRKGRSFVGVDVRGRVNAALLKAGRAPSGSKGSATSAKSVLHRKKLMGLFCQMAVELLTQASK